uniref:Uncharacterized protein n=1 Tax=Glossina pallidipes TaxID=7398 RepID=A0A1B0ABK4_GLOPL
MSGDRSMDVRFATDFIDVREKETRRGTRGVGNPEKRKNLRLYQTRRQRHHQQQQPQQMLADDASDFAALPRTVSTVNTNLNGSTTVTKSQQRLSANNGKGKSKSDSNNNNNNNYDNSNTATLVSAVAVSIGSINDDIALTRHDIKSLENSNKTVNTEAINLRNTYTDSSSNVNRTTSSVSSYSIQPSSSTTSSSSSLASLASSSSSSSFRGSSSPSTISSNLTLTVDAQPLPPLPLMPQQSASRSSFVAVPRQEKDSSEEYNTGRIKPEDLLELQERITKEILNSKLQEKEMLELQEKINREILNSKVFNMDAVAAGATSTSNRRKRKRKNQRAVNGMVADVGGYNSGGSNLGYAVGPSLPVGSSSKWKNSISLKARSLMNLHNNEAGRRKALREKRSKRRLKKVNLTDLIEIDVTWFHPEQSRRCES